MRIFSILAAVAVTVLLAMSILARPQLAALFGAQGAETADTQSTVAPGSVPETSPATDWSRCRCARSPASKSTAP
jgi:multidrug efflux system membrane fusion protein